MIKEDNLVLVAQLVEGASLLIRHVTLDVPTRRRRSLV